MASKKGAGRAGWWKARPLSIDAKPQYARQAAEAPDDSFLAAFSEDALTNPRHASR